MGTNYTLNDFFNFKELGDIQKSYSIIPLGLNEQEFEEAIKTSVIGKRKKFLEPGVEELRNILKDQRSSLINQEPIEQTPAAPSIPMPTNIVTNVAQIDPQSGLTRTQEALLSPDEKVIASKRNQGIMGLV